MKTNISLEEAQNLVLRKAQLMKVVNINLTDALGRVLGRDILAEENIPHFNRSPYDGYALCAEDTEKAQLNNPISLQVIEEVPAGYVPQKKIFSGTAIKVMTGAPIPEEANAVIKYEEVNRIADSIQIFSPLKPGKNVALAGEDIVKGELIAKRGTVISATLIGILASLGIGTLPVFTRPRVAIISTGDELVDVYTRLTPGKIRNSNSYTLEELCKEFGAIPLNLGIVADKKEDVAERICEGLQEADIVITTGGVSVGDYDVVKDALENIGAENIFWRVAIKPGMPSLVAIKENKLIIGLSGNPAAAMTVFQLLVMPLLKKMAGLNQYLPSKIKAVLTEGFGKPSSTRRFLRGKLKLVNGRVYVSIAGVQGNAVLSSMKECNVLVDVPAGSGPIPVGKTIVAHLVGRFEESA